MWRIGAILRERRTSGVILPTFNSPLRHSTATLNKKRFQHNDTTISFQLDYYMSPQFAGIASALMNNTYNEKGIADLKFLPICPVGLEMERVRRYQNENNGMITMGSLEQNIFVPMLASDPSMKMKAVSAMFHESPLCIASLPRTASLMENDEKLKIGTHEDTVSIMKRIFPEHDVVVSPRSSKNTDLISDDDDDDGGASLGAIQAYTTTEVPTLRRLLGDDPVICRLEGRNGAELGYSQVIFSTDECLEDDRRHVIKAFCEATFEGWKYAIREPLEGVEMVREARKMLNLDDEGNDHWHDSDSFQLEMLEKCNEYVKRTFEGDRYGVIDPSRWSSANRWLLQEKEDIDDGFGLDTALWRPKNNLLSGNKLARKMMEEAKASARLFKETYGRKPSLAVITVGELERYTHGKRRMQLYSDDSRSWFSKASAGEANGFDVKEINLPSSTNTDEVLSEIYSLEDVDGIQLMWPLPKHINSAKVYSAIDVKKDVDGIHYVGQQEIGNKDAFPPVTPAAVMALMKEFEVKTRGKRALVVGRSPIVGSPIAHMLREQGAAVTTVHSQVPESTLEKLVGEAQVIVSCAGSPGLIKAEWINGAEVINVGTTFIEEMDSLVSDIEGDIDRYASRYSPVNGGIGPLSTPSLFRNVAKAAWDGMTSGGVTESGWKKHPASLRKSFHFNTYTKALEGAKKVDEMSSMMDHHANMKFSHRCVDGVDLEMEFYTFESKSITDKDYDAAKVVDMVLGDEINVNTYSYNLDMSSVAQYPASPRGSSKLLRVDSAGKVTYHDNFSRIFGSLSKGCHVVFNESRVLDARLFVMSPGGEKVELMILDLGSVDVEGRCVDTPVQAMIRMENVREGDVFEEVGEKTSVEVMEVQRIWEEDEKSDGNGMECVIRIKSNLPIEDYLKKAGSVPIPPYLQRSVEPSDAKNYNNTYANHAGSVAAPTAGLHFTDALLDEIGSENCSYLSLHVGAGTFKPVMVRDAREHEMHAETFSVSVGELKRIIHVLKGGKKSLLVVGTTSCRTLESLFWCGVKRIRGLDDGGDGSNFLDLGQMEWAPLGVGEGRNISRVAALESLVQGLDDSDFIKGNTSLMITPMYHFKVVDHLLTNFHAPDSTLMLLVSAFLKDSDGTKIPGMYERAQAKGYRFLSYGDVCMFSRPGLLDL